MYTLITFWGEVVAPFARMPMISSIGSVVKINKEKNISSHFCGNVPNDRRLRNEILSGL